MSAFSDPAYFILDPFLESEKFDNINSTNPCFSPIVSFSHEFAVNDSALSFDQIHQTTQSVEVPSRESPLYIHEKLSPHSWMINDLEFNPQDCPLTDPQRKRKREKESKAECNEKPERKRAKTRAKKEKHIPEAQGQPFTGYVHVRAKRGEATDPHSLAERVRRKKINFRMKLLQSLVPGCDGLTCKTLILDTIIQHVISLQNQVELLTGKLASHNGTANYATNFDTNTQVPTELFSSELQESSSTLPKSFTEAIPAAVASMYYHQELTSQMFNNYHD